MRPKWMLARTSQKTRTSILVFEVDFHRFALPTGDVSEVLRAVAITDLPGAPLVVEGVIDVRGTILPVLDIRRRFGLPERAPAINDLLVIASRGSRRVVLRANGSASIEEIDSEDFAESDDTLAKSPYVAGLARLRDGVVVIHDLASFLSEAESADLERALANTNIGRIP